MIQFFALVHMLNATQLVWGGWGGGMITFFALVHMLNATQLVWGGWVGWGDDNVPCTCTHVECYATCLGWVGLGDDNVPPAALQKLMGEISEREILGSKKKSGSKHEKRDGKTQKENS